MHRSSTITRIF